jgi:hypothetical protein
LEVLVEVPGALGVELPDAFGGTDWVMTGFSGFSRGTSL